MTRRALICLLLGLALASCGRGVSPGRVVVTATPSPEPTQAAPQPTATPAAPPTSVPTLAPDQRPPQPILFIDDRQQIALARPDGSLAALTEGPGLVLDLDVASDGSVVYIRLDSPQRMSLIQIDQRGGQSRTLASGVLRGPIAEPGAARVTIAVDLPSATTEEVQLTPGVWSIALDGGPPELLAANQPPGADQSQPGLRYAPAAWSPDRRQLLLQTAPDLGPDVPAGDIGVIGLSVLERGGQPRELIAPGGEGRICLQPHWSGDGALALCATPYDLGPQTPALFAVSLADGSQRDLIAQRDEQGRQVAIQGLLAGAGQVTALVSYQGDGGQSSARFERIALDSLERATIAEASAAPFYAAAVLWAPDGSGAAYLLGGERQVILWQPLDGSPPRALAERAFGSLRWGS